MKKFMSFMLALAMVFACLPMYGAAAEDATTVEQTITFDDTAKRTRFDTKIQVWEENGITVTNNKGSSTSNVADYAKPARFYKSSELIIECGGKPITKIAFAANNTTYANAIKNSIPSNTNYTATVSGQVATVVFTNAVESFAFTLSSGQARVDSITVTTEVGNTSSDPTVKVSFNLNYEGAPDEYMNATVVVGDTYGTLPIPTREGYNFEGWFTDAACTGTAIAATDTVNEEHTLYANWTAKPVATVSFDLNYEGAPDEYEDATIIIGDTYGTLPTANREGYIFGGWFTDAECTGTAVKATDVVTATHTLYAKWTDAGNMTITEKTIVFDDIAKRTEFSEDIQVWEENGITVTNNKASSSSNVGNYSQPVRFYKGSQVVIQHEGALISKVVFNANTTAYANDLDGAIVNAGFDSSVSGKTVTVTLFEPVDSFAVSMTVAKVFVDSITVTAIGSTTEEDTSTVVKGCEMTLKDEMIVNFTMDISEAIKNDANAYVQVNIGEYSYSVPIAQVGEKLQVPIDATQMSDEITIVVEGNGESIVSDVFTVSQYCQAILNNPEHEAYHPLVREMLNYGRAAQIHFNGSSEITVDGAGQEDVPTEDDKYSMVDQSESVDCIGASLVYRDKIAVRYYFKGDLTGCTFAVNGAVTELQVGSDNYVEVADIMPQDLDKQVVLTVTDAQGNAITVTYCPMSYIIRMSQKGLDTTKALVKALYNYHLAAKDFSGS